MMRPAGSGPRSCRPFPPCGPWLAALRLKLSIGLRSGCSSGGCAVASFGASSVPCALAPELVSTGGQLHGRGRPAWRCGRPRGQRLDQALARALDGGHDHGGDLIGLVEARQHLQPLHLRQDSADQDEVKALVRQGVRSGARSPITRSAKGERIAGSPFETWSGHKLRAPGCVARSQHPAGEGRRAGKRRRPASLCARGPFRPLEADQVGGADTRRQPYGTAENRVGSKSGDGVNHIFIG